MIFGAGDAAAGGAAAGGAGLLGGLGELGGAIGGGLGAAETAAATGFSSLASALGMGGSTAAEIGDIAAMQAATAASQPAVASTAADLGTAIPTTVANTGALTGGGALVPNASALAGGASGGAFGAAAPVGVGGAADLGTTIPTVASNLPAGIGGVPTPTAPPTGLLDGLSLGGIGSAAAKYGPLALTGGVLAKGALGGKSNTTPGGQPGQAENLIALQQYQQGQQLESYLASGNLPPGIQAGLTSAHDAAAASIRQNYANRGMSGSSAESQDLQNLANITVTDGAKIATGLYQQGVSQTNLASGIFSQLMNATIQQNKDLSGSIANFATALAKMGGGTTTTTTTAG